MPIRAGKTGEDGKQHGEMILWKCYDTLHGSISELKACTCHMPMHDWCMMMTECSRASLELKRFSDAPNVHQI